MENLGGIENTDAWEKIDVPVVGNKVPLTFTVWLSEHVLNAGFDLTPNGYIHVDYISDGTPPPQYGPEQVSILEADVDELLKKVKRKGIRLAEKRKGEWVV